ncbi:hypothetical protein BBEV_2896 [Salisediminibacterium beveridgei]|uniref:Uncharacterized protein n=2 Tax=Salisediminibacterium beveridgei TaxID=632773 RepID=A0A1D7QYY8_9BACI|nr:hypothetical protein BBEV_2896 [Salisediminibacterium beveridgei]
MLILVILVLILFILLGSIRVKLQELLDHHKTKNQVMNKVNGDVSNVYSVRDNDEQGLTFLVYMEERWQWLPGDHCIPQDKQLEKEQEIDVFGDHRQ